MSFLAASQDCQNTFPNGAPEHGRATLVLDADSFFAAPRAPLALFLAVPDPNQVRIVVTVRNPVEYYKELYHRYNTKTGNSGPGVQSDGG